MTNRIIIVDQDRPSRESLTAKLRALGFGNLLTAETARSACDHFDEGACIDLALIDINLPDMDGLTLLDLIKNASPETECIMVTTINESRTAIECLKKGAYDYLVKPVAKEVLAISLPKALERKRLLDILDMEKRQDCPGLLNPTPFAPIITRSRMMRRILKEAELHAAGDLPVLITGETGTGKELMAWSVHRASARAAYPFTPINLASVSAHLFAAEFSTPPEKNNKVRFLEHTDKGTLFLNEIGDLPMDLQGMLLRLIQEGAYSRMGCKDRIVVDVRVIAATNENLDAMIARHAFRKDLYYRIRSGWLHLPSLRERIEDLPLLADDFLKKHLPAVPVGKRISDRCLRCLAAYHWPGNIRELKSVLQSAAQLAQGKPIDLSHLPASIQGSFRSSQVRLNSITGQEGSSLRTLAEVEKKHILRIYRHLNKNKVHTAKALGIGLNTLRRKLASYGLQ